MLFDERIGELDLERQSAQIVQANSACVQINRIQDLTKGRSNWHAKGCSNVCVCETVLFSVRPKHHIGLWQRVSAKAIMLNQRRMGPLKNPLELSTVLAWPGR